MSKKTAFAKLLKLIALAIGYSIKTTFTVLFHLLKKLYHDIGKRLKLSITFKAASVYTSVFAAILFILSISVAASFGVYLFNSEKLYLERSVSNTIAFIGESGVIPTVQIKRFADIEGVTITLLDKQREIIYTTGDPMTGRSYQLDNPARWFISSDQALNLNYRINPPAGDVHYILAARSLVTDIRYLLALLAALAAGSMAAVFLTVIKGSRTLKRMLKPIDNMISTARSVSASELQTRLNVVASHDELKELAETFNEMLDRIQLSYEQQNRFVSDASHELRTPISVIQGYADILRRWGKEDRAVLEESVSAIKNEADNMKDLVEKLLFLARADKETQRFEKSFFAVSELVDEVVKETKLIDSRHNITSEINEPVSMEADRGLIKQALRVFVDNSIKYTPGSGSIKINSYRGNGNTVKLVIEDNGIGISREDLPHIFDRFYKCDKSRTREGGSSGLGLAIAKWIIERHKGHIEVESALSQGTRITITLPVA